MVTAAHHFVNPDLEQGMKDKKEPLRSLKHLELVKFPSRLKEL